MKRYYLLAALALVPLLVAGGVLYQSLDRRVGDLEPRVIRIEGEQIAQAERLRTVVERTESVPAEPDRVVVREESRAVSPPAPPTPRPKPAPQPEAPEATTPPIPRLLQPTSRPCSEIKNDQKRHKCRQRRKEARRAASER